MNRSVIILILCVFFFTCTEEYTNPIPARRVYLEVDFSTPRDSKLKALGFYQIYTAKNVIAGKEYTGYAGVLVTYSYFDGYKAFDLCCPHEVRSDAVIEIDKDKAHVLAALQNTPYAPIPLF